MPLPEAGNARWEGVQAALQLTPTPGLPALRSDVLVPTLDAQTAGIIPPRVRHVRVSALTGALTNASMTASLRLMPKPGWVWRLLRLHAYVRNNTAGAQPREPTLRNLTYADLRVNGAQLSRTAPAPVGAAGAVEICEEVAAGVSHSDAAAVAVDAARITDDYDLLTTWTGAARGTWTGDLLLDHRGELAGLSSVEFYFRRTPTAADVDRYVLCASILALPLGMVPHR